MLDGFDRFIAHNGAAIANQRSIYTKKLCGFADEFFSGTDPWQGETYP